MVVNTAMVRSSEHTTPQHTTCAFCTELRPVCVHYGCQGAVHRRVIAAPCPRASSRGGQQLGQGGGGESPLVRSRESARVHFTKGSSRCNGLVKIRGCSVKIPGQTRFRDSGQLSRGLVGRLGPAAYCTDTT